MDIKKISALLMLLWIPCLSAMAQVISGESFLREVESSFQNVGVIALRVISIALAICAGVTLLISVVSSAKRTQQEKESLLQWFTSFAIGFLCLEIVRALIA